MNRTQKILTFSFTMTLSTASLAFSKGQTLFVGTDHLSFHKESNLSTDSIMGDLKRNDRVQFLASAKDSLVKVRIVQSGELDRGAEGFIAADFLREEAAAAGNASKYLVIQNIATEKTRVYERCTASPGCAHRLILETDTVVGRNELNRTDRNGFLTWLGRYKIEGWKKFAEPADGTSPAWYSEKAPAIPFHPSDARIWLSKTVMPEGRGLSRGSLGWYAANLVPNANGQMLHGTFGWGAEGDRYIRLQHGSWVNMFANPKTAGGTRVENRAIALMNELLTRGTEVLRVYARESVRDPELTAYAEQKETLPWNWTLKAGDKVLESGVYQVDRYPDAVSLNPRKDKASGESGNVYGILLSEFRGVFYVDEGRLKGYAHPASLPRGGFPETKLTSVYRAL